MARYRRTTRARSGYRSRSSRGRSGSYRRAGVRTTRRASSGGRGRAQTVRLVVQMAPAQQAPVMTPAGLMKKAAIRQARF